MKPRDLDELFDRAVAAVRDEPIDPETQRAAIERVGRRLAADTAAPSDAGSDHRIHGCEGFRALLPAWRAGALSEPRRILLEDHLRECVPCRRAARDLGRGTAPAARPGASRTASSRWARPAALAAGLAAVAVAGAVLWMLFGGVAVDPTARVASVEGELIAFDHGAARPLAAGEKLAAGRSVRTMGESRAVLQLADGSRVELAPRSELALGARRDGVVLDLDRGRVIVEAAKQRRGHLYVHTDDCLVSVVGTIFAVNHGARGSRVSVLDGEVRVRHGAELAVLRPGDQMATSSRLAGVPLTDEIAWSRNADEYRARIAALAALGREIDRVLAVPERRSSTRLLDLAPAGTVVYVALPNLSEPLSDAWATIQQRAAENPALAGWWQERFGSGDRAQQITDTLDDLRDVGSRLGSEVVIAVGADSGGRPGTPVVLAEVADRRGIDAVLDQEIAKVNASNRSGHEVLRRVEDPSAAPAGGHELLVWLAPGNLLVASPSAERLAEIGREIAAGGHSGFVGTPLHHRLAAVYAEGAEWLVAADVHALLASGPKTQHERDEMAALGLAGVDQLVIESHSEDDGTVNRARLSFRGERRGITSWLAAPAPMGAVEFVSADAALAVAGVIKSPERMFDDVLGFVAREDAGAAQRLAETERRLGVSLRDDLAASLGGDFAVAVDGPWLPTPSWKVIVEVQDPARLDDAVGRLVEAWNREAASADDGRQGERPRLVWSQEEASGRIFRSLARADGKVLFESTVADGYLIVAPSRALLLDTLARRAAGATLMASSAFQQRLPRAADPNFSGLVWQNLGGSVGDLARLLTRGGDPAAAARIADTAAAAGPSLALAYAEPEELSLVAVGSRGPLGFSFESLLAFAESLRAAHEPPARPEPAEPAAATPARPAA
jgi:ferric-dicitrate binding protein FerR (iron transport regulator)